VVLVLHTYLYGEQNSRNKDKIMARVMDFGDSLKLKKSLPQVVVLTGTTKRKKYFALSLSCDKTLSVFLFLQFISDELLEVQMPQLYKACDAFVLPTRGEGELIGRNYFVQQLFFRLGFASPGSHGNGAVSSLSHILSSC
jgi:glycosyltransferase involved in cell wall biosynthesis